MSKIFLIGYMGVGKTTVGKVLSEKLNCDFIDPDDKEHWIRRGFPNGRSDAWHVSKEKFYDIETEILKDYILSNVGNFVYSTAGSIVLREENVDLMKSSGTIIFLITVKNLWPIVRLASIKLGSIFAIPDRIAPFPTAKKRMVYAKNSTIRPPVK